MKEYDYLKSTQFKKGQTGNPLGMKKGTKHKSTIRKEIIEKLLEEDNRIFDFLLEKGNNLDKHLNNFMSSADYSFWAKVERKEKEKC